MSREVRLSRPDSGWLGAPLVGEVTLCRRSAILLCCSGCYRSRQRCPKASARAGDVTAGRLGERGATAMRSIPLLSITPGWPAGEISVTRTRAWTVPRLAGAGGHAVLATPALGQEQLEYVVDADHAQHRALAVNDWQYRKVVVAHGPRHLMHVGVRCQRDRV